MKVSEILRPTKILEIKPHLFEEIKVSNTHRAFSVSVTATKEIDCGVLDSANYARFASADSDQSIDKLIWFEAVKESTFRFVRPESATCWLIFWNAYSDASVSVAYSIDAIS